MILRSPNMIHRYVHTMPTARHALVFNPNVKRAACPPERFHGANARSGAQLGPGSDSDNHPSHRSPPRRGGCTITTGGVPRLQLGHRLSPRLGELFRRPPGSGSVWSAAVRLMANFNVGHCWRSRAETCAIRSSTICSPTCAATATLRSLPGCGRCADKFDLPYTTGSPLGPYLQDHRS